MYKCFQFYTAFLTNDSNLVKGEFPRQDDPFETNSLKELDFFRGVVVHLRACDYRKWRKIAFQGVDRARADR